MPLLFRSQGPTTDAWIFSDFRAHMTLPPDARVARGVEPPPVLALPDLAPSIDAANRRDTFEHRAVDATLRNAPTALLEVRLRARARSAREI